MCCVCTLVGGDKWKPSSAAVDVADGKAAKRRKTSDAAAAGSKAGKSKEKKCKGSDGEQGEDGPSSSGRDSAGVTKQDAMAAAATGAAKPRKVIIVACKQDDVKVST